MVFRTVLKDRRHSIYTSKRGALSRVADTGSDFSDLGHFSTINDAEISAFTAKRTSGSAGIFTPTSGEVTTVVDTSSAFESYRGVLLTITGTIIFYATPKGRDLGIYGGPDPTTGKVMSISDTLFGTTVFDFALNPVSINAFGQMTIRIKLVKERQLIVRCKKSEIGHDNKDHNRRLQLFLA